MFSKEIFAKRLSDLRKDAGMKQSDVSMQIGVGRTAITNMELGERSPSIEVFSALIDLFHVPAAFLLNEPPFESWEQLMQPEVRPALLSIMAQGAQLDISVLESTSLGALAYLFQALFARVELESESGDLRVFPRSALFSDRLRN